MVGVWGEFGRNRIWFHLYWGEFETNRVKFWGGCLNVKSPYWFCSFVWDGKIVDEMTSKANRCIKKMSSFTPEKEGNRDKDKQLTRERNKNLAVVRFKRTTCTWVVCYINWKASIKPKKKNLLTIDLISVLLVIKVFLLYASSCSICPKTKEDPKETKNEIISLNVNCYLSRQRPTPTEGDKSETFLFLLILFTATGRDFRSP